MKMKTVIFAFCLAGIFPLVFQTGELQAQAKQTAQKALAPTAKVAFCDEVIPSLKKDLKVQANTDCRTVQSCVKCRERKTNELIYITVTAHPDKRECKAVSIGDLLVETAGTEKLAAPKPPFEVDILQAHCFNKGATLEVVIPGENQDCEGQEYLFLWEVDGRKAGHARKVECVCGKEATVRVTQSRTGQSVRRIIKLNRCPSDEDK